MAAAKTAGALGTFFLAAVSELSLAARNGRLPNQSTTNMDTAKLITWLMLGAGCGCVIVGCIIALRCPNQWTLLVLSSFALVCFGVLPAKQWLAAWCWNSNRSDSSPDRHAKDSNSSREEK